MTIPKDNIMSDTTKDAVTLKPCPFCGGTPHYEFDDTQVAPYGHYHSCNRCAMTTGSSPSKEAAIVAWNRRAPAQVQAEAVREWQSIETAPKTGRTLLLGYPNSAGKWRTVRGQWMSEAYIAEYWEEPDDAEPGWFETSEEADDVPNCWRITPTHWMPLPAAPSTGDQS